MTINSNYLTELNNLNFSNSLSLAKGSFLTQSQITAGQQVLNNMVMDTLNSNTGIEPYGQFVYPNSSLPLKNVDTYTKAMLFGEGANNGTVITDESGKTWTAYGNAVTSTADKKYGTSSLYFDGTGDYIDTPSNADFNFGSGDFTIQAWVKLSANSLYQHVCGQIDSSGANANASYTFRINVDGKILFRYILSGTSTNVDCLSAVTVLVVDGWTHVAVSRVGNNMRIYKNGVSSGGVFDMTGVTINSSSYKMAVGRFGEYVASNFYGYIDSFELSKGIGRYTSDFTPSDITRTFDLLSNTSLDDYTKALLLGEGTNNGTVITDASGKTWTANGNAVTSTAQYKYGTSSLYFDGAGDYVDTPDHDDFDLSILDFTVQFWVKKAVDGVQLYTVGQLDSSGTNSTRSIQIEFNSANKLISSYGYSSSIKSIYSTGIVTVAMGWTHLAFIRNGNTITQYINGIADGVADVTGITLNNSSNKMTIGRAGEYTGETFNGYIDSFEFSKGIARYTTNFVPTSFNLLIPNSTPNYSLISGYESFGYSLPLYYVSRDGGSNYTQCLKDVVTDISSQPTPSYMRLRVVLTGNARINFILTLWWYISPMLDYQYNPTYKNVGIDQLYDSIYNPNLIKYAENKLFLPYKKIVGSGTPTLTLTGGDFRIYATAPYNLSYNRPVSDMSVSETKTLEMRCKMASANANCYVLLALFDGVRRGYCFMYGSGTFKYWDNAWNEITLSSGNTVSSYFIMKMEMNNSFGIKMYLNGTLLGTQTYANAIPIVCIPEYNFQSYQSSGTADNYINYVKFSKSTTTPKSGTIVWNTVIASSVPTYAYVTADETLGTGSITYYMSRDNGTTYTQCAKNTLIDISSQPSNLYMKLKAVISGNAILNSISWGWK
jgi:hypothetical protein